MSEALVSIIIAMIGLIAGLLGAFIAGKQQVRLEEQKWLATRWDELDKERRIAIADLCRKLVVAVQAIARLAWYATYQPTHITPEDIKEYDTRIHGLLPEIMGALIIVSALDSEKHASLNRLVRKVYNLDDQFSKATIRLAHSRAEGIQAMADCHPEVVAFWGELNEVVDNMFSDISRPQLGKMPQNRRPTNQ